ncbi:MFS general substrate transporter [Mycena venus]|uniref:MFS general substrate transporter n=1 Tax=Mycena venus TaxID=2733690 RepID=A0A8H6XJ07_9AGAR|nr:MFS general substrate transporter [Mycena venus]
MGETISIRIHKVPARYKGSHVIKKIPRRGIFMTMDSPEKIHSPVESSKEATKLDHNCLPLVPQPSDDPEDPLNWSRRQKYQIVCISSLVAFFGLFALATTNPSFPQIGLEFGVSAIEASYITTIAIAAAGLGSFIWAPISNVYGRRPVLIFSQAVAVVAGWCAAYAKSYNGLLVARFFAGLGVASNNVVTFAMVSDVFCLHERGKMLGIVTVAFINGPHVASLPGGLIAQSLGWRWAIILPSILTSICWVLVIVALPETLYVRGLPPVKYPRKYYRFRVTGTSAVARKLEFVEFARPFQMLKYFPVVVLAFFGAVAYTLGSVMPAQTVSALFKKDKLLERSRRREGRVRPEARLHGMWPAAFLLPAGLLVFGFSISNHELKHSYIGVTIGMAVTCFAVQMITTPIVACDLVGFQFSGITYACVSVFFFLPVLWIMIYGERLRAHLGEPSFNKEI